MVKSNADFVQHLRDEAPELVEEFGADYVEPVIAFARCNRCGATVGDVRLHKEWHYSLSLTIYALGATLRHLLGGDEYEG